MKLDLYTKVVLTVIAIMISTIVFNQYVEPKTTAFAQSAFAGVQVSAGSGNPSPPVLFDPKTGDIWQYTFDTHNKPYIMAHWKISKPGGPATVEFFSPPGMK